MKYLKRFWNWLLGKTTLDEKIKERVYRIKEEFQDGKKRRGRPKKK